MLRDVIEVLTVAMASMSAVTFVVYGVDKSAASRHRRRVPERVLHVLALAGGWPGALLAQRAFRHKTVKRSFRAVFWLTVAVNCLAIAGVVWFAADVVGPGR